MHARARLVVVSIATGLGLLVPAGLAVAGTTDPGKACENPTPREKNPNCGNREVPGRASADPDHDGVATSVDNCPGVFNPHQADSDRDGHGDPCDHLLDGKDGDGRCDAPSQLCGTSTKADHDGDGIKDASEDPAPPTLPKVPS